MLVSRSRFRSISGNTDHGYSGGGSFPQQGTKEARIAGSDDDSVYLVPQRFFKKRDIAFA